MASGVPPRPPVHPPDASLRPGRPQRARVSAASPTSGPCASSEVSLDSRRSTPEQQQAWWEAQQPADLLLQRPQTHCGARSRQQFDEEVLESDPLLSAAGARALQDIRTDCRSCLKLRLKLAHEERARVKAQEQLVRLQQELLRLRKPSSSSVELGTPGDSGADLDNDIGRQLDTYKREVALLQRALQEREAFEVQAAEERRQQQLQSEHAKQAWEGELAALLCDMQELEARNRALEAQLAVSSSSFTTKDNPASFLT